MLARSLADLLSAGRPAWERSAALGAFSLLAALLGAGS